MRSDEGFAKCCTGQSGVSRDESVSGDLGGGVVCEVSNGGSEGTVLS